MGSHFNLLRTVLLTRMRPTLCWEGTALSLGDTCDHPQAAGKSTDTIRPIRAYGPTRNSSESSAVSLYDRTTHAHRVKNFAVPFMR